MGSNSFGKLFTITTWGESHGKALGVVIDGCPAGISLSEEDINIELKKRQGGNTPFTTPRKEADLCEIYSGIFEGKTTGAPLSIIIKNTNKDPSKYTPIKDLYRPGHANYTYLKKYGIFDYKGGGRASARETVCRVAAGAVAKKILQLFDVDLCGYIKEIGGIKASIENYNPSILRKNLVKSPVYCPDEDASKRICDKIKKTQEHKDSLGGIVELIVNPMLPALGDPVYEKLEANLAKAMMSLPATKGVEFGMGFEASSMLGSNHNDTFTLDESKHAVLKTNNSGGLLGGISTGMPLILRVAFKPTSSIDQKVKTVNTQGLEADFQLPKNSRHDPCVAIRAVPIVEAMTACCLVDAILINRACRI